MGTEQISLADPTRFRGDSLASGLRWTLWGSLLGASFGYGTNILLARVGPKVLGTYGPLSVCIGIAASLLYLGGNVVIIRFLPQVNPAQRWSFCVSYCAVIDLWVLPWFTASAWPRLLRYLFGEEGSPSFQLFILWLSPLYILHSMVIAALKGILALRWSQILTRFVTVGSFLVYATLYFFARTFLVANYVPLAEVGDVTSPK